MKKLLVMALLLTLLVSITAAAEVVTPVITGAPATIVIGDAFTLTATTEKSKSEVASTWSIPADWYTNGGAADIGTVSKVDGTPTVYQHAAKLTAPTVPGTYRISYSIRMYNVNKQGAEAGQADAGTAYEDLVVNGIVEIVVEYPAAPAVANKLLKAAGIKPKYKDGNYISQVAQEMGPGTLFKGVPKDEPAAYEAVIRTFLKELGAKLP